MSLVNECLAHTCRAYPDGYGFALTYLSDNLPAAKLRDGAFAVVAEIFQTNDPLGRKNKDMLRFVTAYAHSQCLYDWAVEAAQLVLAAALEGHAPSKEVLRLCGHPGY